MKVLIYSTGQDTGGQGTRLKTLLERHTSLEVRSAIVKPTYLGYPTDRVVASDEETQALFDWADVLHLRHVLTGWEKFSGIRARPTFLHHHGAHFIDHHRRIYTSADALGIRQFVSGLEMQTLERGTTWLPQPHDLDALAAIRAAEYRPSDVIRIAQAPTRESKGWKLVQTAVRRLAHRYPVEFDLIHGVSWDECLRRKARADILVDQVGPGAYGYGNNAVEAWAMGIPVISEAPDPAVRSLMLDTWTRLPFFEVHAERTIERALRALIADDGLRGEYAMRGLGHARLYHDYPAIAKWLSAAYASQPPTRGSRMHVGRLHVVSRIRARVPA
jgi:hypothetical protein